MKSNSTILSVTILHYNRPHELVCCLKKTLAHLKKYFKKDEYEIIVVDNASTQKMPPMGSSIKLITMKENIGVKALNYAFKIAQGTYVLELDDDSYPLSGLKKAIAYLDRNPQVGILGLNIKGEQNPIKFNRHLSKLTGFVGCGVLMRKTMLQIVKGYSPWIFIYANEHDLSMHALYRGFETRFFAFASVMHTVAKTHRTSERLTYHSSKNYIISYIIYFNGWIRIVRTFLLGLLILLKIPLSTDYFKTLYFTLKGFTDGMLFALKTKKRYLPRRVQFDIFINGFKK